MCRQIVCDSGIRSPAGISGIPVIPAKTISSALQSASVTNAAEL